MTSVSFSGRPTGEIVDRLRARAHELKGTGRDAVDMLVAADVIHSLAGIVSIYQDRHGDWRVAQAVDNVAAAAETVTASQAVLAPVLHALVELHTPRLLWLPHPDAEVSFTTHDAAAQWNGSDDDPVPFLVCAECARVEGTGRDETWAHEASVWPCRTIDKLLVAAQNTL